MRDVFIRVGDTTVEVASSIGREDVRFVVDGPRLDGFALVNETNGMMIRYTGPIPEDARLWIATAPRNCYLKPKRAGSESTATYEHLHIPQHQAGTGWMRLERGINRIQITRL